MQTINPIHDPLSPLNTRLDQLVRDRRAVRHPEKVIGSLHVHGGQDRSHQPKAEFVQHHFSELTEDQLEDYGQRRDRIRQLCFELSSSQL